MIQVQQDHHRQAAKQAEARQADRTSPSGLAASRPRRVQPLKVAASRPRRVRPPKVAVEASAASAASRGLSFSEARPRPSSRRTWRPDWPDRRSPLEDARPSRRSAGRSASGLHTALSARAASGVVRRRASGEAAEPQPPRWRLQQKPAAAVSSVEKQAHVLGRSSGPPAEHEERERQLR